MLPKQDVIHSQGGDLSVIHTSKGKLEPDTTKLQMTAQRAYFFHGMCLRYYAEM